MAGRLERLEAGVRQLEGGDDGLHLRLEAGGHQHVGRHVIFPGGVVVVIGQASYQVPSGCCGVAAGVHRSHFWKKIFRVLLVVHIPVVVLYLYLEMLSKKEQSFLSVSYLLITANISVPYQYGTVYDKNFTKKSPSSCSLSSSILIGKKWSWIHNSIITKPWK
jgi:hypothetical protein